MIEDDQNRSSALRGRVMAEPAEDRHQEGQR
jgi:hypothetical protein